MAHPKSKIQNPKFGEAFELMSGSVEETQTFGERVGRLLRAGDVVALYGDLGSGKTTLIQGIAQGLGRSPDSVKSPTFVLMREYRGEVPLVHIDGYRLEGAPAVSWLDLDLLFSPQKITVIEWAERFAGMLPEDHLDVRLHHVSTNRRRLSLVPSGARAGEIVAQLQTGPRDEAAGD
jgi:tRNA threonylcarbamoyladenosine biosynthesis protein TsaE